MSDARYNGWANWETWLYNLHHCQGWQDDAESIAAEAVKEGLRDGDQLVHIKTAAKRGLADYMRQNIWECLSDAGSLIMDHGFFADVIHGAIREIDFEEVAAHYTDELVEGAIEEQDIALRPDQETGD